MRDRRKARELALQVLYQMDIRETSAEETLGVIFSRYRFKPGVKKFSERLVRGTAQFILPIDSLIEKYAKNWTLERMTAVDRNVLRLAIYELLFLKEIPSIVTINEAVEIAKRYGIEDSGKFVNGILDKIRKERGKDSSLKWAYLKDTLQKNPYFKKLIRIKGKEKLWLVGGYLRDYLLGKKSKDLDLITEDLSFKIAQEFTHQMRATLVTLSPTLRRVVLPEKTVIDFNLKRASSLKADLIQRDFTINALALDLDFLRIPSVALIDPDTGLEDLINKKIKLMREKSLKEDPLRILRAFRLASQLGFEIEDKITSFVQQKSFLIKKTSKERIRDELFLFLKFPSSYKYLENLPAKTLLREILNQVPHTENLRKLETTLSDEKIISKDIKKRIILHLEKEGGGGRKRKELLKLISLIFPSSYEKSVLSSLGRELKLSHREIKLMKRIEMSYPQMEKIEKDPQNSSLVAQFLLQAKEETIEVLLLFLIANFDRERSLLFVNSLLEEYFQKSPLIFHPPELINGEDLIKSLRIHPGPQVSYLLNEIHKAQVMEKVKTREEALKYASELLSNSPKTNNLYGD